MRGLYTKETTRMTTSPNKNSRKCEKIKEKENNATSHLDTFIRLEVTSRLGTLIKLGYFPPSRVSFGKKFVRAPVSIKLQETIA